MEPIWTQGISDNASYFINSRTFCVKAGNNIRFIHEKGPITTYHHKGCTKTYLAVHPIDTVFALSETNTINCKVFIITYPTFETKILGHTDCVETLQLQFSHENLIACIASVPTNKLIIWNYKTGHEILQAPLNRCVADIFQFCPINCQTMLGVTARQLYVWKIEPCEKMSYLTCEHKRLPSADASIGIYHEPKPDPFTELIEKEENPIIHKVPHEAISGLTESLRDEFDDYKDIGNRIEVVSMTWSSHGFAIVGCAAGHVAMIDPTTVSITMIFNPLLNAPSDSQFIGTINENPREFGFRPGDLKCIVYTVDGLLVAAQDGYIRRLQWSEAKYTSDTADIVSHVKSSIRSTTSSNATPLFTSVMQQMMLGKLTEMNRFMHSTDLSAIANLSLDSSHNKLIVTRSTGQIQVYSLIRENEALKRVKLLKSVNTSCHPYVGVGTISRNELTYAVTADAGGYFAIWNISNGEQMGSISFGIQARALRAISGLPLVVVGFEDGQLAFIDCSKSEAPRVVRTLRFYRKPINNIFVDSNGEVLAVVSKDPKVYFVSLDTDRNFEPLGFIIVHKPIQTISFAVGKSKTIYGIILYVPNEEKLLTAVSCFKFSEEVMFDPKIYRHNKNYEFRDELIALYHFNILLPLSGAYLKVEESVKKKNLPKQVSVIKDSGVRKLTLLAAQDDVEVNEMKLVGNDKEEEDVEEDKVPPTRIYFYSLDMRSRELAIISLTEELESQEQSYIRTKLSIYPFMRESTTSDSSIRLQSKLQNRTNLSRIALLNLNQSILEKSRATRIGSIPRYLNKMPKKDARANKEKAAFIGVSTYRLLNLTHDLRRVMIIPTSAPNLIITTSAAGSVKLIRLLKEDAEQLETIQIHEYSDREVVHAELTPDLRFLVSASFDGLFCAIELGDRLMSDFVLSEKIEIQERVQRRSIALKLLPETILKEHAPQSSLSSITSDTEWKTGTSNLRNNRNLSNYSKKLPTRKMNSIIHEALTGPTHLESLEEPDSGPLIWLEEQREMQRTEEVKMMSTVKEQIIRELAALKDQIEEMANVNDTLTDLQKAETSEFELDTEEHNAISEETNAILKQIRQDVEQNDLMKSFTHNVLQKRCWTNHEVKGRSLLSYDIPLEVPNYPLYPVKEEEARLLRQAQSRRRIEIAITAFMLRESAVLLKWEPSNTESHKVEEIDDEEEQGSPTENPMLAGGTAKVLGVSTNLLYSQLTLFTVDQKITQTILLGNVIRQLKLSFNRKFDDCLARKQHDVNSISKKLVRINRIIPELDPKATPLSMNPYELKPIETPEVLLTCTDVEIDVEKYLTPKQVAALEEAARLELERLRLEKLDNWRERGLDDMMGGVLEIRREDELKKDIPKPYFLREGKPELEWTDEEKKMYKTYMKACKELEDEREKYRKFLETDMKKNQASIDEIKSKFNECMVGLFELMLKYEFAILQEDLKIWKMKTSMLLDKELHNYEKILDVRSITCGNQANELSDIIKKANEVLERVQEEVELLSAEDRLMEKGFRKEFHDVHGPIFEILLKAYKRRPKRVMPQMQVEAELETEFTYRTSITTMPAPQETLENHNPYLMGLTEKRSLEMQWKAMPKLLSEFDEINKMADTGIEKHIWERLYRSRIRKVDKEMEIKVATEKMEAIAEFLQHRKDKLAQVSAEITAIEEAKVNLTKTMYHMFTDMDINIVMMQGQVEIEVPPKYLVEDYNTCLLLHRNKIEKLNSQVVALSGEKIKHMETIKSYKKRFRFLEWDLREMLMRYEDLLTRQNEIKNFKITREIQRYLQHEDYDAMVTGEISNSEQTYSLLKQNHIKQMDTFEKRIHYYSQKQSGKLAMQNENLAKELNDLNVSVWEARNIYEMTSFAVPELVRTESCYKSLMHKAHLDKLMKIQTRELETLRKEVERLRLQNFPSFPENFA